MEVRSRVSRAMGVLLALALSVPASAADIEAFTRREQFRDMKLSPDGRHLAATVLVEDRAGIVVLRLSDMGITARFSLGRNTDIPTFQWANNERLLLGVADKFGMLAHPQSTGEIVGLNADGRGGGEMLVGQRVPSAGAGTRIKPRGPQAVWATLVDTLPDDDRTVLVTIRHFGEDAYTRAERMDVRSGRRQTVATVPVRRAGFVADHHGSVRFAMGAGGDNVSKLFYRAEGSDDWTLINDEGVSGRREAPLGLSADGATGYLLSDQPQGPDNILAYDLASGERREVLRDDTVDPYEIIYATAGAREPIGALFMDGLPRKAFFNEDHPDARLHRMLDKAFEGELVRITSRTRDGRMALLLITSDRNSGDFFLFDTQTNRAERVASRREWLEPSAMAAATPMRLRARDGLDLHGYLHLPAGSSGKQLPMVVLPHGGPYFVQDSWEFDGESQMLAAAGFAVLRVNFRGSSGYGYAFERAGARQWGGAMQDDLTDATRWAIDQGIADPRRICIYGASYGAYAALMGTVREPDLYRCAVGYVGVYDLTTRQRALSGDARSLRTFSDQWIGSDRESLVSSSPNRMADRIKVPVLLVAGEQDEIAPVEHTQMMEAALRREGAQVETLYFKTEGHGLYVPENLRAYYGKLLGFLDEHLGPAAQ